MISLRKALLPALLGLVLGAGPFIHAADLPQFIFTNSLPTNPLPASAPAATPVILKSPVPFSEIIAPRLRDPGAAANLRVARQKLTEIAQTLGTTNSTPAGLQGLKNELAARLQRFPASFYLLDSANQSGFARFILNNEGLGLDAIRIKNGSSTPKKLAWICGYRINSPLEAWNLVPVRGSSATSLRLFHPVTAELNKVPWKDASKPYKAFCQATDKAELLPGEEYILWFAYVSARPQEIFAKFDLLDDSTPTANAADILKALKVD